MDEARGFGGRVSTRAGRERASIRPRGRARPPRRRVRVIASDDEGDSGPDVPPSPSRSAPAAERAGSGGGPRSPAGHPPPSHVFDMEADISELEPATFTTIPRGQPEPMLRLSWNHKVNLIATKVLNPLIHLCEKCDCPILAYGRMIPCKHVLCYDCGKIQDKCWRCGERATRVERAGLGKLFMCLHDGKRYDVSGCRRTYLSQRDLQAHINHRHRRLPAGGSGLPPVTPVRVAVPEPLPPPSRRLSEDRPPPDPRDPRRHEPRTPPAYGQHGQMHGGHGQHGVHPGHPAHGGHGHGHGEQGGSAGHVSPRSAGYGGGKSSGPPMKQQQIPVMTTQRSSNLITIPIQGQEPAPEQQPYGGYQPSYSPAGPQQHTAYQQPAAFYQSTPPPAAAGYGRPFPPSGPPPQQPPPPTAYTAPHGAPHAAQHPAQHAVPHGTQHGAPHAAQHPTQHGAPHGAQHGAPHAAQHPTQHGAPHGAQHGAPHTAPHAVPHAGQHGAPHAGQHAAPHVGQHVAPQSWSAAPPLGRPPPTSHYYR